MLNFSSGVVLMGAIVDLEPVPCEWSKLKMMMMMNNINLEIISFRVSC